MVTFNAVRAKEACSSSQTRSPPTALNPSTPSASRWASHYSRDCFRDERQPDHLIVIDITTKREYCPTSTPRSAARTFSVGGDDVCFQAAAILTSTSDIGAKLSCTAPFAKVCFGSRPAIPIHSPLAGQPLCYAENLVIGFDVVGKHPGDDHCRISSARGSTARIEATYSASVIDLVEQFVDRSTDLAKQGALTTQPSSDRQDAHPCSQLGRFGTGSSRPAAP